MQRRFNYTNRIRILQSDVRFSLTNSNGKLSFDASLDLGDYDLPLDSLVFVEAYRQTVWIRFEWGTIGCCQVPSDRSLAAFDSPEDILFRVRVTSPGTEDEPNGLLLAEADRIRMRSPDESQEVSDPLLPVVPSDLGPELWRVDFSDKPRLLINFNSGGDYKRVGTHPAFVATVYPGAMRIILTHILFVLNHRDLDDRDDFNSRWIRFCVEVLGTGEPPDEDEGNEAANEWIDNAVSAFAKRHNLLDGFKSFWLNEVES